MLDPARNHHQEKRFHDNPERKQPAGHRAGNAKLVDPQLGAENIIELVARLDQATAEHQQSELRPFHHREAIRKPLRKRRFLAARNRLRRHHEAGGQQRQNR